jgi:hypothetical protein
MGERGRRFGLLVNWLIRDVLGGHWAEELEGLMAGGSELENNVIDLEDALEYRGLTIRLEDTQVSSSPSVLNCQSWSCLEGFSSTE